MELIGYSDVWSVRPGGSIGFHIHCAAPRYEAQLVRLQHGDENPRGPGFKEFEIASLLDGTHPGHKRVIHKGSYGLIELGGHAISGSFSVSCWIWPTAPGTARQGLVAGRSADGATTWALALDESGRAELRVGGTAVAVTAGALDRREWHFLAAVVDVQNGTGCLFVHRKRFKPGMEEGLSASGSIADSPEPAGAIVLAAGSVDDTAEGALAREVFNGKLSMPRLFSRALADAELRLLAEGGAAPEPVAAWDLGRQAQSARIVDVGPFGLHGTLVNRPARLMTGPFWRGEALDAGRHDAIHFHDDDVSDAGWPESLRLEVPPDMQTGVYALRLKTADAEDHLPFFVCPPAGAPGARIALLMPTLSYLIYSNESLDVADTIQLAPLQNMELHRDAYAYVEANGLKSAYDLHSDGSGICHVSMRRPIIDFRPKVRCRTFDAPHQFPADLYLIDWLTEKGFAFDVITDHDLHAEGLELLAGYIVVMTGSHPEYWTQRMLDALDTYFEQGGRLMYLGGNGFYWVAAIADDDPGLAEVRRAVGWRTWQSEPGETWLALTGEPGGLWRDRGRAPHKTVGIGFTGAGYDRGLPYRRSPESYEPRFAFVFKGVEAPEFGAGPALVLNHGAAGFEVDSANVRLGTPAHATVLAAARARTNAYQFASEEILSPTPFDGGATNPLLRADMILFNQPKGGAVFSVGSITWIATLHAGNYDSDTSRITENVLRAFADPDWSLNP